jgi:nitrate reductase NapE component
MGRKNASQFPASVEKAKTTREWITEIFDVIELVVIRVLLLAVLILAAYSFVEWHARW